MTIITIVLWRRVQKIHKTGKALVYSWEHVRGCTEETANHWLARFQKDDPKETFILAAKKPPDSRLIRS